MDIFLIGICLEYHKKKDEYTTSFEDFDITFTFKNKMFDKNKADKVVAFLKSLK